MKTSRIPRFTPASPSPLSSPRPFDSRKDDVGDPSALASLPPSAAKPEQMHSPVSEDEFSDEGDDTDDVATDYQVPPQFLARLARFPLFDKAPKMFHAKVAANLKLVSLHPQQYIIRKGEPAKSMYWILKGTVSVTSTDGEAVYAELNAGSFFGEIGILYNRPRTATVVARTRVLLGVLTSDNLNTVLKNYPVIERRIRDEAQERMAIQEKKRKQAMGGPAYSVGEGRVTPPVASTLELTPAPSIPPGANSPACLDCSVSVKEFIKSLPIFEDLPSRLQHKIALMAEPVRKNPFEYIFRTGDVGSDIYFIICGEVEVISDHDTADTQLNEKILARLGPGSYFGEFSFLSFLNNTADDTRSASIRSVLTTDMIVVRSETLQGLCRRYPSLVAEMKRTADERISKNKYNQGKNRLSIDNLINKIPRQPEQPDGPTSAPPSRSVSPVVVPTSSLFSTSWSFTKTAPAARSRSVSPVTTLGSPPPEDGSRRDTPRKRRSVYDASPTDLTLPPQNPSVPSMYQFHPESASRRGSFQYMPHSKRLRLASVSQGRRRSSILANPSPLPDRLLLRVFEFLPLPQLMRLRGVSRRWRQLLNAAPNLCTRLDLTAWNTSIDDRALISITDFVGSRPTYIDISNCFHVTDEGFSYLVNEVGMSGRIQTLKMRSSWETSAMAIMDLTAPSVGQFLEELDLSNCRKVRDNVIERLVGWDDAESPPSWDEDFDLDQIGCKRLKILNVGYCKHLTDAVMMHLANHASKRLESLDLTRCTTITDAGFQYWSYKSFAQLKKLSLKDCTFLTDKAIIALASSCQNLEILDLNFCCALSDVSVEVLAMGCHQLRELDLSFCGSAVSDSSLVAVSMSLTKLEKLIVKGCIRVTRAGVDALISGRAPLTYIDIRQCKNAHVYPEGVPAQKLNINPQTRSAFVRAGPYHNVIEIML
ncbi:hypothetical protein DICA1_A10682 [Diutina catenulata]